MAWLTATWDWFIQSYGPAGVFAAALAAGLAASTMALAVMGTAVFFKLHFQKGGTQSAAPSDSTPATVSDPLDDRETLERHKALEDDLSALKAQVAALTLDRATVSRALERLPEIASDTAATQTKLGILAVEYRAIADRADDLETLLHEVSEQLKPQIGLLRLGGPSRLEDIERSLARLPDVARVAANASRIASVMADLAMLRNIRRAVGLRRDIELMSISESIKSDNLSNLRNEWAHTFHEIRRLVLIKDEHIHSQIVSLPEMAQMNGPMLASMGHHLPSYLLEKQNLSPGVAGLSEGELFAFRCIYLQSQRLISLKDKIMFLFLDDSQDVSFKEVEQISHQSLASIAARTPP